jgi:hypothetical protein
VLLNPTDVAVTAVVAVIPDDGAAVSQVVEVPARSRVTFDVGGRVPEVRGHRLAAEVTVTDESAPGIVVERATYWDSRTRHWAAGVALRATPLP